MSAAKAFVLVYATSNSGVGLSGLFMRGPLNIGRREKNLIPACLRDFPQIKLPDLARTSISRTETFIRGLDKSGQLEQGLLAAE